MRKNWMLGILLMLYALSLTAGPAYPGRIVYTQPDGSTIGIFLHGDEFGHWVTDDAGRILEQDADGYWHVSTIMTPTRLSQLRQEAAAERAAANAVRQQYAQQASAANFGSPKIPVILVGFKDKAFSKSNADFDHLLNQEGYRENNAIGSVLDYFKENSFGQFTPQFEVLGPVQLDNNMSYYGAHSGSNKDVRPEMALVHAAQKLDATVDFSRYDNDHDGVVDFVMFYFAGYDEAQSGVQNAIWSHAWYLSSSPNARNNRTFDRVNLDRYFCTAELKGNSGSTMCSIGTTCHEFAHTLGLPDFYDSDYEDNGTAASMYDFDLMAGGSYNGNSTSPPYLNAEEVYEIGWLSAIPEMPGTGSVTLPAVNFPGATSYSAYRTQTSVNGEYFVYETRRGERWDAPLPAGMMVYHVDKSSNRVTGSRTASSMWSANTVNAYSAHPCCYVVPAVDPARVAYYSGPMENFFFPGSRDVRFYTPVAWNGNTTGFQLSNISYSDGVTTFGVANSNTLGIEGHVKDSDGNPLSGAAIKVEPGQENAPARRIGKGPFEAFARKLFLSSKSRKAAATRAGTELTVTTDAEGYYFVETGTAGTFNVTASRSGYVSKTAVVTVSAMVESQDFSLLREGEELPSDLYAWPTDAGLDEYLFSSGNSSLTAQNLYPSSKLEQYAGKQIKSITFYLYGEETTVYEGVHVIIDYGNERKATLPVSPDDVVLDGYTTVDLRAQNLFIPSGKDVFAGVGYRSGGAIEDGSYTAFAGFVKTDNNDNLLDWAVGWPYDGLVSTFNLTATGTRYSWDVIFDFTLSVGDYEAPDTGYNYIADPKNGRYSAGDAFNLSLVETEGARKPGSDIAWYLDDEPVSGPSVTLSAGTHVVEARFSTTEGKQKVVELTLTAE